ncbi:MAG: hypothetical protein ACRCR4_01455, partial [Thiotrichaceae bacterium]
WSLFSKQKGNWVLMTLLASVGFILLNVIPLIGSLAALLIFPGLIGGMLYSAQEVSAGKPIKLDYLWIVFKDPKKRSEFLKLGLVLIAGIFLAGIFMGDKVEGLNPNANLDVGFGTLAFLFLLGLIGFIIFGYASALILFRSSSMTNALKESISLGTNQLLPIATLYLLYTLFSIIAAIPFGLGFLILWPVTIGAIYVSYQELDDYL